jgi:hypothetical protein
MPLHKLCLVTLLVGVQPLASVAQTTTTAPRYYVGVGGSMLNSFASGSSRLFGPSLTVGRQFKPRVALQVGTTVGWRNYSSGYSYTNAGQTLPTVRTFATRSTFITIPILLRRTLTPAVNRFQIDALVGLSLLVSTGRNTITTTYGDQTLYSSSNRNSSFRGSLVAGPAVRYGLTPRVALAAEIPVNFVVGNSNGRFSDHFFYNFQVGARYNFG